MSIMKPLCALWGLLLIPTNSLTMYAVSWGVLVAVILLIIWHFHRKGSDVTPERAPVTVDEYASENGTPVDVVVLDPTRSNELDAVILVYPQAFVINGERVPRETVRDVTFNNAANPYIAQSYQVVLTTTLPGHPTVSIDVGNDAQWASEVAQQIAQHTSITHN